MKRRKEAVAVATSGRGRGPGRRTVTVESEGSAVEGKIEYVEPYQVRVSLWVAPQRFCRPAPPVGTPVLERAGICGGAPA